VEVEVFASGGIGSLADIEALFDAAADRVAGVILGRALYESAVDLKQAIDLIESRSQGLL
ncbi:MAG: 1-(5-phosphoribosyl)-5-((5-phosphoribosylamino)methylideneamino)imidazole-4-carboxamide isomerase, partial [Betaproteobacteria bacterium]|nr:1-(5-phosphoribosyl)-5-((5-phosphoribosylamino)methylideneamino)imidazole-4-carboxamide isomerase [Betaproteobacteria bacterium]